MHTVLSSVLLTLALMGCAGVHSSGGSGGGPNEISSEKLRQADLEGLSALQIIQRVRLQWLRSRGSSFASGQIFARIVVDGVPSGGLDDLPSIRGSDIDEMRYLNARDATTRFGTGYDGGAILVVTRKGDSSHL